MKPRPPSTPSSRRQPRAWFQGEYLTARRRRIRQIGRLADDDPERRVAHELCSGNLGERKLNRIWESWHSKPSGERVRSFAIVTTEPNELCAQLHNRMPVMLAPEAWPQWLGEEPADEAQLKSLLVPYPSGGMVCWPVSQHVGSVKNNDPGLVEPVVLP